MSKEKKYYYTDPFEYIYMQENFGVKGYVYPSKKQVEAFRLKATLLAEYKVATLEDAIYYIKNCSPEKIYVTHEDPEFFNPKLGDYLRAHCHFSETVNNCMIKVQNVGPDNHVDNYFYLKLPTRKGHNDVLKSVVYDLWEKGASRSNDYSIITRDDKHFFMPEIESDETVECALAQTVTNKD